jgi:hypothetical protein
VRVARYTISRVGTGKIAPKCTKPTLQIGKLRAIARRGFRSGSFPDASDEGFPTGGDISVPGGEAGLPQ